MITAGIDVGSTYTKVVLTGEDQAILGRAMAPTGFRLAEVAERLLDQATEDAGLGRDDLDYVVTTGYGRHQTEVADIQVTDLTAAARGVSTLFPGTKTILPRKATAKIDIRFGPDLEPDQVVAGFKKHFADRGYDDIEVVVRDCYTWSKTDFSENIVQKMLAAYRYHGVEPEIWPMFTASAPYFVFQRILGLPVVNGGLGHGGRGHVANEYMSVQGLKDFEKFAATLLYAASG